jgi:putative acetyltransferase
MFVTKSARRLGLAKTILGALEAEASRMGYGTMRLETGYRQLPAAALYIAYGFRRIQPFGEYVNDPTSVCFEKTVDTPAERGA